MKINRLLLLEGKEETYEEDIDFSSYPFNPTHVRNIPFCHCQIKAVDYGDILRVIFHIKAQVIAACSYTLEDVPLEINIDDELSFSDQEGDEELIYEPNNIIDLDPHILSLIFAKIPIKVVKPGAKLPEDGQGYSIISEDEYYEKQSQKKNSAWDILDSIPIEEENK